MRALIYALLAGAGLMACNGGSDSDAPATASDAAPSSTTTDGNVAGSAPDANAAGRETAAAFERGTTTATSDVLTIRSSSARDPGPRAGNGSAGMPLRNLTPPQLAAFNAGKIDFEEAEEVDEGLGPTMNLDSCGGCHSQPATGGTSPAVNPQVAFASKHGMTNRVPSFITANGPVREARFVRNADGTPDGGVHALFTLAGAAPGCSFAQAAFARQLSNRNVVFRIPTPVFGAGLIEAIPDSEIFKNQAAQADVKRSLGIRGRANLLLAANAISGQVNRNGNDGTVGRFGWKAQNKS